MNRFITLLLAGITLLGLAIFENAFAQSDPLVGIWQLNLAKSKFSPGPPPKSQTVYLRADGQNIKGTNVGIDADGNPTSALTAWIFDGMPRPAGTRTPNYDATAFTRVNTNTVNITRLRAGQVVQTLTVVVSPDGKATTATITGTNANGQPVNTTAVYDKQ